MMSQPSIQLFVREFETLTEAHVLASQLSGSGLRWIDISATARGAWICGRLSSADSMTSAEAERLSEKFKMDLISLDEPSLKALLSLGEKPESSTTAVGIIEGTEIATVLQSAAHFSSQGFQILEIRIKRSGTVPGAYAYFALTPTSPPRSKVPQGLLPMTEVPLVGDYRRFFL